MDFFALASSVWIYCSCVLEVEPGGNPSLPLWKVSSVVQKPSVDMNLTFSIYFVRKVYWPLLEVCLEQGEISLPHAQEECYTEFLHLLLLAWGHSHQPAKPLDSVYNFMTFGKARTSFIQQQHVLCKYVHDMCRKVFGRLHRKQRLPAVKESRLRAQRGPLLGGSCSTTLKEMNGGRHGMCHALSLTCTIKPNSWVFKKSVSVAVGSLKRPARCRERIFTLPALSIAGAPCLMILSL